MELNFLKKEEEIAVNLKSLYKSFGFSPYKMASFEEYSLYTTYIDFLTSGNVATFSANGKLLALRPDVTLSILKNIKLSEGKTKKLFYDEKVYRTALGGKDFKEISQIGVEVLGEVDEVSQAELLILAYKTLQTVGKDFTLEIAHMGIISSFIDELMLNSVQKNEVIAFLRAKNVHGFMEYATANNCPKLATEAFIKLINAEGEAVSVLNEVITFAQNEGAIKACNDLLKILSLIKNQIKITLDFSIANTSAYYNGIIIKGYVLGVPNFVLTGGRYDILAQNLGKSICAVGFALYLGELSAYINEKQNQVDTIIIYSKDTAEKAFELANQMRKTEKSVQLAKQVPANFTGKVIYAEEVEL
ncbi:MAG: hypothetical protein E7370_04965 [Clostridiales bacterium]|nr:hypothetical protein [Clostridiales bacterium]